MSETKAKQPKKPKVPKVPRSSFLEQLAKRTNQSQAAVTRMVAQYEMLLAECIEKGYGVEIDGVGTLKPVVRAARMGRNPKTGESTSIPARITAKLVPTRGLKQALNHEPA